MPRIKKLFNQEKKEKTINSKQILILYDHLITNKNLYFDKFFNLIIENKIKIFVIDFFITNYSKTHNIILNNDKYFDIYNEYKNQLKSYNKKYFDPYKRINKFELTNEKTNQKIITTVGQMNYFKWLIENKIIDYIEKNYIIINKEYEEFMSKKK